MSKERLKLYKGKRVVIGDKNLVTKHEIHVEDISCEEGGNTDGGITDDWEVINAKAYGIEWTLFDRSAYDTTVVGDDYDKMDCVRVGNMEYHKTLPCHQWKGCIANAEKINYYLDENDWSKKADGTPSNLDGTDGTVRVEIPAFYYKSWKNDTITNPTRKVMVSPEKIDDSWYEFPHILLDAYYATLDMTDGENPKAVSVINTTPEFRGGYYQEASDEYDALLDVDPRLTDLGKAISYLNIIEMSNFAKNADAENLCYDIYKMVVFWMPAIEYATLNLKKDFNAELTDEGYAQGGLSAGCIGHSWLYSKLQYKRYSTRTPNGFTNEFGNKSGAKLLYTNGEAIHNSTDPTSIDTYTATADVWVNRYRGIENIFGDTGYLIEGLLAGKSISATSDPAKFSNSAADKDRFYTGIANSMDMPVCVDFLLNDSCEMFGTNSLVADSSQLSIYSITNMSSMYDSALIQMGVLSGDDDNPLVFGAGGFAYADAGGPGFLFVDGGYSLVYAAGGIGFRTLSRVNGDSKKLQYRNIPAA